MWHAEASLDVASRRSELALRMALGANPSRLVSGTLGHAALLLGAGLAMGGVLSIWATRALRGLMVLTGPVDVSSVAIAAAVLIVAAAAAVLPAARRAALTEPLIALRSD